MEAYMHKTMWVALLMVVAVGCGRRDGGDTALSRTQQSMGREMDYSLADAKATTEQKQAAAEIRARLFSELGENPARLDPDRAAIVTELTSAAPSREKLHALVDQYIESTRVTAYKMVDAAAEVSELMTVEQREEARAAMIEGHHSCHFGNHGEEGGGSSTVDSPERE
jgi:hypothetical protein